MAKAIEAFQGRFRNQKPLFIGFRQSQGLANPIDDHMMFHLKFEPVGDGLTFHLSGAFWDKSPTTIDGKPGPTGWTNMLNEGVRDFKQGDPLEVPQGEEYKITIAPICGPVRQLGPDTFAIRFNRVGLNNLKRSEICLWLAYPGDGKFKRFVERAGVDFPLKNTAGDPQNDHLPQYTGPKGGAVDAFGEASGRPRCRGATSTTTFAKALPPWTMTATSPSRRFPRAAPTRSKSRVVAWQWGRSTPPLLQTAEPVEKTFSILAP